MVESPRAEDFKLLPHRIDWIADHAPEKVYAIFPTTPDSNAAGLQRVTFLDFARAIDRAAWWLEDNLGKHERVFAYSGPPDLRWSIFLVAAIKTGKTMVHASPWARPEGLYDLFNCCSCSVLLFDRITLAVTQADCPLVDPNVTNSDQRSIRLPPLSDLLDPLMTEVSRLQYRGTWLQDADQVVAIFHTSGITETPKPIFWSNRRIALWDSIPELARKDHSVLVPDVVERTIVSTLMPAHADGQSFQLFLPVYLGSTIVLRHTMQNQDPSTVQNLMVRSSCTGVVATPGMLTELTKCPRTLALLRSMQTILVIGLDLVQETQDLLRHPGITIQSIYARSDVFPCVQQRELTWDSRYIAFHESSMATFRPHPTGLMELTIGQKYQYDEPQLPSLSRRGSTTFRTGELFSRHHNDPDRWQFVGYTESVIALANGEVVDVTQIEEAISAHPLIKSALIYGDSRPRLMVVLEPWSDVMSSLRYGDYVDNFLDEIWPGIERANSMCSSVGQLCRQLTLVMQTPAVRTSMGTVDRKQTAAMLREEMDELYENYRTIGPKEVPGAVVKTPPQPKSRGEELRRNLRRLQAFREANPYVR